MRRRSKLSAYVIKEYILMLYSVADLFKMYKKICHLVFCLPDSFLIYPGLINLLKQNTLNTFSKTLLALFYVLLSGRKQLFVKVWNRVYYDTYIIEFIIVWVFLPSKIIHCSHSST